MKGYKLIWKKRVDPNVKPEIVGQNIFFKVGWFGDDFVYGRISAFVEKYYKLPRFARLKK